jgi:hypothetical protein
MEMGKQAVASEKRGARIKLSTCDGRLCIEASPNQGKNKNELGPWKSENGKLMVIPKGY